jgi:hypothetical protein
LGRRGRSPAAGCCWRDHGRGLLPLLLLQLKLLLLMLKVLLHLLLLLKLLHCRL